MNDKIITDYYVAVRTDLRSLERIVGIYINKGYQPFGNLFMSNNLYHQPIVKYTQKEKEKETIQ